MSTPKEILETAKKHWNIPWSKILMIIAIILLVAFIVFTAFRVLFVNFVDNYQLGYQFDARNGKITILEKSGYYVTPPFVVSVQTIDMRPMQVCINANQRVLNCKLIQFDPKGIELFLSWHGRKDYFGPSGGNDANGRPSTSDFSEILKSYAYDGSGKNYPFLKIIRDLKPEEAADALNR